MKKAVVLHLSITILLVFFTSVGRVSMLAIGMYLGLLFFFNTQSFYLKLYPLSHILARKQRQDMQNDNIKVGYKYAIKIIIRCQVDTYTNRFQ